jgi:hypothetical protein
MGSLADYVLRISQDPAAASRFRDAPDEAREEMVRAGLSEEQQEVLLSNDARRISLAIGRELFREERDPPQIVFNAAVIHPFEPVRPEGPEPEELPAEEPPPDEIEPLPPEPQPEAGVGTRG